MHKTQAGIVSLADRRRPRGVLVSSSTRSSLDGGPAGAARTRPARPRKIQGKASIGFVLSARIRPSQRVRAAPEQKRARVSPGSALRLARVPRMISRGPLTLARPSHPGALAFPLSKHTIQPIFSGRQLSATGCVIVILKPARRQSRSGADKRTIAVVLFFSNKRSRDSLFGRNSPTPFMSAAVLACWRACFQESPALGRARRV